MRKLYTIDCQKAVSAYLLYTFADICQAIKFTEIANVEIGQYA